MADTQIEILEGTLPKTLYTVVEKGELEDGTKYEKRQALAPRTLTTEITDSKGNNLDNRLDDMQTQIDGATTEIEQTVNDVVTQRANDDIAKKDEIINDNLLKNGGYKLNTNGLSEYVNTVGETLNKWNLIKGTVKKNESGITLTRGSDVDLVFFQQLDHNQFSVENTYTFSVFMLDETVITHSFVLTSYEMSTAQILLGNNFYADVTPINGNLAFRIFALAGATEISIKCVKLELGSIATEYVEPDIEIEKVRCGVHNADMVDGYHMSDYFGVTAPTIPEGADLNTYLIAGVYRCATLVIAKTLLNAPAVTSGFKQRLHRKRYIVWQSFGSD